jgi:N,N'-diacetyllegionaminate synthase
MVFHGFDQMRIGSFDLEEKILIVAEIGNNHEGDSKVAMELVRRAAECGVDAVKFQTFRTEHYVSSSDSERFNRLKSFELSFSRLEKLAKLARSLGLLFISTPFDLVSARTLEGLVDAFKIASGDVNFYPLIASVSQSGLPVIISSGASDLQQVKRTVEFVKQQWAEKNISGELAILHCVSSYPVPFDQANLLSIPFIAESVDCVVGYSDHTLGLEACVLAVALGARILEKHFTLDKNFSEFRDHRISADPSEMEELTRRVKAASVSLGERKKAVQPCEEATITSIRRSIVAGADLKVGSYLALSDLTWIRPAGGLSPGDEGVLIGRRLKRDVSFGELLTPGDVE